MRVLAINTEFARGGAARISSTLHRCLQAREDVEPLFVYGRGAAPPDATAARTGTVAEVYAHAVITRLTGLQCIGSPRSTRQLQRIVARFSPDIVHLHNIHGYFLDLSFLEFLSDLECHLVWTLHDAWALTGRCAYFFECTRWKTGCGHCPDLRRYPRTYVDSSSLMWKRKRAAISQLRHVKFVAPSRWLGEKAEEAYPRMGSTAVIPNGIRVDTFVPFDRGQARMKLGIPADRPVIMTAAADLNDPRKGVGYLLTALNAMETPSAIVLTMGLDRGEFSPLPHGFEHRSLGYVTDLADLVLAYSAADVFCITSLDENFPTTVLEAMACGTPIVGFSVGGIPEQVTTDCGILVPVKDSHELARALDRALQDRGRLREMSVGCRARAVSEYSIETFCERYVGLYKSLLGKEAE